MKIKKMLVRVAVGVVASSALSVVGAAPALAADCVPVGTFVGDVSVTACFTLDTFQGGYPSVGTYVVPHGYVSVCQAGACNGQSITPAPTGIAVVPNQYSVVPTSGTPIPNGCVGSNCTPSAAPGYQVVLFGDPAVLVVRINGIEQRPDVPTVCFTTAGVC